MVWEEWQVLLGQPIQNPESRMALRHPHHTPFSGLGCCVNKNTATIVYFLHSSLGSIEACGEQCDVSANKKDLQCSCVCCSGLNERRQWSRVTQSQRSQ